MRNHILALSMALICGANGTSFAQAETEPQPEREDSITTLSPGEVLDLSQENWSSILTETPTRESGTIETRTMQQANTPAPACVNAVVEKGFIQVYNNCGFDVRVKVVLAFAPDSACNLVVDGTRHNISPAYGRIDRVEMC